MMRGDSSALPAHDKRAWEVLVDAALPTVWSTAQLWGLTVDQAGSVCDAVMLRVLDMLTTSPTDLGSPSFLSAVRRLAFEECEREQRLRVWAGESVHRTIDLTKYLEPDRVTSA